MELVRRLRFESGLLRRGGARTTACDTGGRTQWDAPSAWPPLQLMLIEGLHSVASTSGCHAAGELARALAQRWVSSSLAAWRADGVMWEKLDAEHPGSRGGGGEYDPQVGFGWSNGVVLALLDMFPDLVEEESEEKREGVVR